jgi:Arc/MetJ-type ribon-helix-helix transcriptional regulator
MTVELASDVEAFVDKLVHSGACADPGQFINDVLRSMRDQQRRPFEVTPELEAWLLEAAEHPASPLTPEDFAGIRTRVRARSGDPLAPRRSHG